MKIEHKVVPVVETKVIDEAQGILGAFVSVTGVVDSVKDRIIPGAYQKTLVTRTPKGCWSHDWDKPVSKTLSAEELLPGDDRLPTKTRTGEDWPSMAGALYVETQFNLETEQGRDAFSNVKFYGSDAEWSIGYNVPPGASKVDQKTGVRELSYIDLYEYSPVLFGAMSLTSTAGVKDAQEAWKAAVTAGEAREGQVTESERKEGEATFEGGELEPGLVQATNATGEPVPVAAGFTEVTDDTPVTTTGDPIHQATPGHTGDHAGVEVEPRATVEGPPGGAEVSPAKSAEFTVGLNEAGEAAMREIKAWFESAVAEDDANPSALFDEAVTRQKAILDDRSNYTLTAIDVEDGKAMVTLTGSYEERQQALRRQAPTVTDGFDLDATDEWGYPRYYLGVEATFANRVVYAAYDMAGEDGVRYFEAGYTFDGQQATLRTPREVRVEAAVVAKGVERQESMRLSMDLFRKAAGQDVPTPGPLDAVTPKAEPVPEAEAADEGEATTVTLTEADLLMLERLKLIA